MQFQNTTAMMIANSELRVDNNASVLSALEEEEEEEEVLLGMETTFVGA